MGWTCRHDVLLALDEALDRFAAVDTRAAEMVKLCFCVGLRRRQRENWLSPSARRNAFGHLPARGSCAKCEKIELRKLAEGIQGWIPHKRVKALW